ncbi:MAG: hypothetical protein KC561_00640 [Myxococcales bacterium]|nr:hypothetical protein [Myxococcales bacterium]
MVSSSHQQTHQCILRLLSLCIAVFAVACSVDLETPDCLDGECPSGLVCYQGHCVDSLRPDSTDDIDESSLLVCPTADCLDSSGRDENGDGVDGVASANVYVASFGSDANPGTADSPLATIGQAVSVITSRETPVGSILVIGNVEEPGTVTIAGDGVFIEISGGFSRIDDAWVKGDGESSRIEGTILAMSVEDGAELRLVDVELIAAEGNDGSSGSSQPDEAYFRSGLSGESSVALRVRHATLATTDSIIQAADGGEGGDGVAAVDGENGSPGSPGESDFLGCATQEESTSGGSGGQAADQCSTSTRAAGGDGGTGLCELSQQSGEAGQGGAEPGPTDDSPDGEHGQDGSDGLAGAGGGAYGYVRDGMWYPVPGRFGGGGQAGGGGGGGASGSRHGTGPGSSGGGGGAGGCGGGGGPAGGGGGGSIAILSEESQITLIRTELRTGDGGDGGDGASGGSGGSGGDGAESGMNFENSLPAGDGGDGGDGGNGGDGGSGAGGIAVALLEVGQNEVSILEGSLLNHGTGGAGGEGESPDLAGDQGFSGEVLLAASGSDPLCPNGTATLSETHEVCVFSYEASLNRVLPEGVDFDQAEDQATSLPDVAPAVNIPFLSANDACERAGGTLCTTTQLVTLCESAGEDLDPAACNVGGTAPVTGQAFPECVLPDRAVHHLLGNVEEWTIHESTLQLVGFGGSYLDEEVGCRSVSTAYTNETFASDLGFRCCVNNVLLLFSEGNLR